MSKKEERSWLEPYAPLGIELANEVMLFVSGITLAVLYSFVYLVSYIAARNELYEKVADRWILRQGAIMPAFDTLIEGRMIGFGVVMILMLGIIVYHYIYHHMDSKLVYLMKRLPSKWELHKRCLVLPIAGILVTIACMLILWLVYYGIYLLFTPQQCLPF